MEDNEDWYIVIRDDNYDEIYSQTFFGRKEKWVYKHAKKLTKFFKGEQYEVYEWKDK